MSKDTHIKHLNELPKDPIARQDMLTAGWDGPGWYFWDETSAHCHGPFGTRDETIEAMNNYVKEML